MYKSPIHKRSPFTNWLILFCAILLYHLNRWGGVLTYSWMMVSDAILALWLICPVFLFTWVKKIDGKVRKAIVFRFSVLLCIFSFFRLIFFGIGMLDPQYVGFAGSKGDSSFELIKEVDLNPSKVKVYLANCGATCGFGIIVRQELPLFAGINLSKTVYQDHGANSVMIKDIHDQSLKIHTGGGTERSNELFDELNLKKFVFF
jgi:hypothetical protein